jgi:hypothetical protein
MAKNRKPTPKSQKEISNSLINPYDGTNPNDAALSSNNSIEKINRGTQLSFKDDTTKLFTVGIQDIDESIVYYFQNIIKPFVIQNGQKLEVPIVYGAPDRWKTIQKDGYFRDQNGKIMSPLIIFKRTNLEKVRSVGNKMDANMPHNYGIFKKPYSSKNAYDKFSVLNNRKPVDTYYATVFPDYVNITYSCVIYTYYIEQMNKIVESINYASDSYWGDPQRFKFRAMIDSFALVNDLPADNNRIVKSTFDIKLNGYIIPDIIQKDLASIPKYNSAGKIIFSLETVVIPSDNNNNNIDI